MSAIGSLFRDGVPLIDEQLAPIKSNDTPFACVIPVPNEDYPEYSAFVFRADAAELGYLLSKCQELQTLKHSDDRLWTASVAVEDLMDIIAGIN